MSSGRHKAEETRTGDGAEDRRGELLRIAARLFAERGYEATTIREIAKEARILSGSIYYHFDTKEEMLHAVVRGPAAAMAARTRRIAASAETAEVKAVALILLSFEELFSDQDAYAILYNERYFFRRSPSFAYVADVKATVYRVWQEVLANGVADGLFRDGLDLFMTITTVIRMLNTCADWYRHGGEHDHALPPQTPAKLIAFNLAFVLHAVRAPDRIDAPVPRAAAEALLADPG